MTQQNTSSSDYDSLTLALRYAEKQGYTMLALERAVFNGLDNNALKDSLRHWANGIIFDHSFARAVFGTSPADRYGQPLLAIQIYAEQVAYKFDGRLYNADRSKPSMVFARVPDVTVNPFLAPLGESIDIQRFTQKLRDLRATLPFETHQIKEISIAGAQEMWQWHLEQMVLLPNPYNYLREYIAEVDCGMKYSSFK